MSTMRVYRVPGRYRAQLAAAVNEAVEQIKRDIYRRANGHPPVVPDFMISETPAPDAIVAIDNVVIVADATQSVAAAIAKVRDDVRAAKPRKAVGS